jgi:hypothetical protein
VTDDWRARARCRDLGTDLFFPEATQDGAIKAAQAWCRRCPVDLECAEFGLSTAGFGIWGGIRVDPPLRPGTRQQLLEDVRRRLRQQRRIA